MLAVLERVIASVRAISPFRSDSAPGAFVVVVVAVDACPC